MVLVMGGGGGYGVLIPTGIITYLDLIKQVQNASLYNQTFIKVVDDSSVNNTDPPNKIESTHVSGTNYTDIPRSCLLDYGEPKQDKML